MRARFATAFLAMWWAMGPAVALADQDPWGNVYPRQCEGELPSIPVYAVSQRFLDVATGARSRYGVWSPTMNVAYILKGLSPKMRAATEKHEFCHAHLKALGLNPYFHGDGK